MLAFDWVGWAQVVAAVFAVTAAVAIPVTAYWRRPDLSLSEDVERVHSRVEGNGIPYIRLLVGNAKGKRAAHGTRVLVDGYRSQGTQRLTTLEHPSLDWPSAPEAGQSAALVVFGGGTRPVGFARLIRVRLDEGGGLMRPTVLLPDGRTVPGWPHYPDADDAVWYLWPDLAFALDITDNRDKLPPVDDGYLVRLIVGADDGTAHTYEVHVNWDGGAPDPHAALGSVQLAVRRD